MKKKQKSFKKTGWLLSDLGSNFSAEIFIYTKDYMIKADHNSRLKINIIIRSVLRNWTKTGYKKSNLLKMIFRVLLTDLKKITSTKIQILAK
jgi:hypothetical protein